MGELEAPFSPSSSDDRLQWQRMLAALVEMVQSQQSQIETLADDRKFLEDYIRLQRTSWAARARLLESHISNMKKEEEMVRRVHTGMSNLMVSAKEREALLYKKQLEIAESDLEDLRVCVDSLGAEIVEFKENINCRKADEGRAADDDPKTVDNLREKDQCIADREREIRKLKLEHKKVISKKEADIFALIAEKDFVWNQFKKIDEDFTVLVNSKQVEAEQAKRTIDMLQNGLENVHSLVNDKDEAIVNLEAERNRLEVDVRRCTQEAEQSDEKIKKLQQEVEELRSLANQKDEAITRLRSDLAKFETSSVRCTRAKSRFFKDSERQRSSRSGSATLSGSHSRKRSGKSSIVTVEGKATHKRRLIYEGSSGSRPASSELKRCLTLVQTKASPTAVETPRLFSAKLKVPKLKNPPPSISS